MNNNYKQKFQSRHWHPTFTIIDPNMHSYIATYVSNPQFPGSTKLCVTKGNSWFLRDKASDKIIANWDSIIAQANSHFPAGIRFSQEEFCRSSGEHRLQAKSIRESCSLIARENIAVPNPSSEGATSTFFPSHGSRSAERFFVDARLDYCSALSPRRLLYQSY